MRTKHYSALFAFVAAFAMSAVVANFFKVENGALVLWNEAKSAQKITELLKQDIANGQDRIDEGDAILTLSYIDSSENIDDSNLPADFQQAWRTHMKAWRNQSDFLLEGRKYRSVSRMQSILLKNSNEINHSWLRVLQIAAKHGAEIPGGALNY